MSPDRRRRLTHPDRFRTVTIFRGASLRTWHCETPHLGLVSFDVHACRRLLQCVVSSREVWLRAPACVRMHHKNRRCSERIDGQQQQILKAILTLPCSCLQKSTDESSTVTAFAGAAGLKRCR